MTKSEPRSNYNSNSGKHRTVARKCKMKGKDGKIRVAITDSAP